MACSGSAVTVALQQYNHEKWLKPWIDTNTNLRKEAKTDFEKDYFKLMNNACFGKTMENVRGRIDLKAAFDGEYLVKYQSLPTWKGNTIYGEGEDKFVMMEMGKKKVKLDKPIYAGFTILDLSKLHMYDFHYNIMKPKYGNNVELLMTDTDSFVYKIKTDDFYKEMFDMKQYFDLSEYDKSYQYFDDSNKKVLGKFKDETPKSTINTFIGVRSKCYSIITDNKETSKNLKGVPKAIVKKKIETDHYKKCVLDNENHSVSINCIRNLKGKLTNFTLKQNKLALSNTDDKRVWNGITSKAYGHYSLKSV